MVESRHRRQVTRQSSHFVPVQVDQQAFAHNQCLLRLLSKLSQNQAPFTLISQVQLDPLQPAHWFFVGKNFFFVLDDARQIDLHPRQRCRQIHPVWARIQAGCKVDHHVCSCRDLFRNRLVHRHRSRNPWPLGVPAEFHLLLDARAAISGKPLRQWVAKQRVGPLILFGAIHRRPQGGV